MECDKCERGGTGPHPAHCTVEARFHRRVLKGEKCWTWTASTHSHGYGQFRIGNGTKRGKIILTHRYSWELHNGPIPDGLNVLHKCDNPPCVRPDHLFLGTQKDNSDDMRAKGRGHTPPLQTHCKRGHPFEGVNVRIGSKGRVCRECANAPRRNGRGTVHKFKARKQTNGVH